MKLTRVALLHRRSARLGFVLSTATPRNMDEERNAGTERGAWCWQSHGSECREFEAYVNYGSIFVNLSCPGEEKGFTFMLPCIVIDFFLNNQPDALFIPILFCYKTPHVWGIFSAHHQEFSTVHSALVSFMLVSDYRFQAESGWTAWKRSSETWVWLVI